MGFNFTSFSNSNCIFACCTVIVNENFRLTVNISCNILLNIHILDDVTQCWVFVCDWEFCIYPVEAGKAICYVIVKIYKLLPNFICSKDNMF